MLGRIVRWIATALLFLVVGLCLAAVVVPRYLDRIYYRGPASGHFDGNRFFNPEGDSEAGNDGGHHFSLVGYLLGRDKRPPWPDHVAVAQAQPPARVAGERMLVTWVGHSTVLVQTQGLNILTDPVWSKVAGPFGIGPHRVARPGIAFADLPKIDLVLVSHDHYDHLDLSTLAGLWKRDHPLIVTSLGNDSVIRQSGARAVAKDWGGAVAIKPGVSVVVTRAHHWSSRWFTDRNRALWSSFVVRLPGGNLFFAGDSAFGDGQWASEAARYGPIRLALIPIGAFRFYRGEMSNSGHMGPPDAVRIFERLNAAHAIGIHWGTFRLSWEGYLTPPRLLRAASKCAGTGTAFTTVPIGRTVSVPAGGSPPKLPYITRAAMLSCLDTPAVRAIR